jgi:hypothetical protein
MVFVGDGGNGLKVVDVSNPASPALVGGLGPDGYTVTDVVVSGSLAIAASTDRLHVIDVSMGNPRVPDLPTGLVAQPAVGGVRLQWVAPEGWAEVAGYRAYMGASSGAYGPAINAGATTTLFVPLTTDAPTYFALTAYGRGSGESDLTPEVSAARLPATDSDGDTIPFAASAPPCTGGVVAGCSDNCPYTSNTDQLDRGGVGTGLLGDSIGDACQCGDVNGDGRVTTSDSLAIRRSLLIPPTATLLQPALCDVGGSAGCGLSDSVLIRRALLAPPTATVSQQCAPAMP